MSLSPDVREAYIKIIDDILAASDLNTISEKRIRKGLEKDVHCQFTQQQKPLIKALIMERFDVFAQQNGLGTSPEEDAIPTTEPVNGHNDSNSATATPGAEGSPPTSSCSNKRQAESDFSRESTSKTPPPKKRKPDHDIDADALFAARLQAEENKLARPTRGSATRRTVPVKKKITKSKTAKKVKAEDDSDFESGQENGTKKEVNRSGGFHKPMTLSPALSALLGEVSLSRPQTVKRLWQYIRENNLQDPNDRRQIRCDDRMRAVFKQDRVQMFTMNKILNQNLYAPDE